MDSQNTTWGGVVHGTGGELGRWDMSESIRAFVFP